MRKLNTADNHTLLDEHHCQRYVLRYLFRQRINIHLNEESEGKASHFHHKISALEIV